MTRRHARSILIACSAVAAVWLSACHKAPPTVAPAPSPTPTVAPAPPAPPPAPLPPAPPAVQKALTEDEVFRQKTLDDLNREGPLPDAYFDYDRAELRADAREALSAAATWLLRWPTTRVTIEGHCDERGTAEYNLALGQRRSSAARQYLVDLGVPAARLIELSYGKERPACGDSNEACWQKNRRAHLVITAK